MSVDSKAAFLIPETWVASKIAVKPASLLLVMKFQFDAPVMKYPSLPPPLLCNV